MPPEEPALKITNLSKCYKIYSHPRDLLWELVTGRRRHREFWALKDISFEVKKGEVVGVIGRNGAGKSTLLKILTGVTNKTGGEMEINGRISSILELGTGFHPEYTGRENIIMGGLCLGLEEEEVRAKMEGIIAFSELEAVIDQPFRTYSSGMKARLTFAVAVSVEPDIFIVDEALAVGDALFQEKCFTRLREIVRSGATVFFVTHALTSMYELCSSALLLDRGRLLAQDIPRAIGYAYEQLLAEEKNAGRPALGLLPGSTGSNYGSSLAVIEYLACLAEDGRTVTTLVYGQAYTLRVLCSLRRDCANVNLGLRFQTLSGLAVTGLNTLFEFDDPHLRMFNGRKGEIYQIDFKFDCRLSNGQYMVGGGLATFADRTRLEDYHLLHVLRDAVLLTVTGNPCNVGFFPLTQKVSLARTDLTAACRGRVFFLFGCARSGTTSLCTLFDQADNAVCLMEPAPNLNRESRLFLDGRLPDPEDTLKAAIVPRALKALARAPLYGEKNVTLYPFAETLARLFQARLIYIARDGRDTVASLRRWHQDMFGDIYREAKSQPPLTPRAQAALDRLPAADDESDFSRPRPRPGDPYFERWPDMTHHEMLCWYWNACNMRILEQLKGLPAAQWRRVDYSAPDLADQVQAAAGFLGLTGLDRAEIEKHLAKRINSVEQRTGEAGAPVGWRNWTDLELDQFWAICSPAMRELGYYVPTDRFGRRWTPDYGAWWASQEAGPDFFERIYADRRRQHETLMAWAKPLVESERVRSVLDIGCGHSLGYANFFAGVRYTGLDISPRCIDWCRANYQNEKHGWVCGDFIKDPVPGRYDLVFCQGTMENFYDMDAALRRLAGLTRAYLYVTGFLGYHENLAEHQYRWNERFKSYSNSFSLPRAAETLKEEGFTAIDIQRVTTGRPDYPEVFLLIAERKNDI